jgi:hypothetical protein
VSSTTRVIGKSTKPGSTEPRCVVAGSGGDKFRPERFLKERFDFRVVAHLPVQLALASLARLLRLSAVKGLSEPKTADPYHFLKEWYGFNILAHNLIQPGETIEALYTQVDVLTQEPLVGCGALPEKAVRPSRTRACFGIATPNYLG